MTSTLTHDLQQFRYVTSLSHPLPWPHIRQVNVPELRHEAPDLPLMANLISGLCSCDISLGEIRGHNDSDILQLLTVLQACLQFSLWSQKLLKEKLLEVQSAHAGKRVSARQLENLERRHHALGQEMHAIKTERDTLSLGIANHRSTLLQMETTIKLQERQLQQERVRNAELVAKLEKALSAQAPVVPLMPRPGLPHTKDTLQSPARHRRTCTSASVCRRNKATAVENRYRSPTRDAAVQGASTASVTSDTSYGDSCLPAEEFIGVRSYVPRPSDSLDPPPPSFLDWRTLVRYIIREELNISTGDSAQASPSLAEVVSASTIKKKKSMPGGDVLMPVAPCTEGQVQSFLQELTAGVTKEIHAYTTDVAAHAEDIVRSVTQQHMKEAADVQRAMITEMKTMLSSLAADLKASRQEEDTPPSPAISIVAPSAVATGLLGTNQRPFSSPATLESLAKKNTVTVAPPMSTKSPVSVPVIPTGAPLTNDSKQLSPAPQTLASAQPLSNISSPPSSYFTSFLVSNAPQGPLKTSDTVRIGDSKPRAPFPSFSADILRSPPTSEHGKSAAPSNADSDRSLSAVPRPDDDDERQESVDRQSIDNSSSHSPSDSYQSSTDRKDISADTAYVYTHAFTRPSSPPPVYPSKAQTPVASSVLAGASSPTAGQHPRNLHNSMRSDMSEISSHGSSRMLQETRAQLQALLDEEKEASKRTEGYV